MAIERAVGQIQKLKPIEPSLGLQGQQRALDRCKRHGPVHRIFRHRKGFDIIGLRARQNHSVMMRLVAVAVDDGDIARSQQRLHGHLVGG
ncbi:hypothetical protein D3C87_1468980 [compost metagenome]